MMGKGGLGGLMKQAQQMQENMQKAQAEIAAMEPMFKKPRALQCHEMRLNYIY